MTDEAKAIAGRLRQVTSVLFDDYGDGTYAVEDYALAGKAADLIETQAREIERLKDAAIDAHDALVSAKAFIFKRHGTQNEARNEAIAKLRGILGEPSAALAGDSHDQ